MQALKAKLDEVGPTFDRSIPIPNAPVAQIIGNLAAIQSDCVSARTCSGRPAWYGRAGNCACVNCLASCSQSDLVVAAKRPKMEERN